MKHIKLKGMTTDQLVTRFVDLALAQDEALLDDRIATYNRLYKDIDEVRAELRSRLGDQRYALVKLLTHENAQVRLKAAITVLALVPEEARQVLQNIIDQKEYPQRAYAWDILDGLDKGTYVPT